MLSICAVIAVRNEAQYLPVLLPILASQRIDVAIIDNESTDETPGLLSRYSRDPIILVEKLPYRGYFSLIDVLTAKSRIYSNLKHDWVVHHDADEIMEHRKPGLTLRAAIEEAHAARYNVLNFDDFTFLPEPGSDYQGNNYYTDMLQYYFFRVPDRHLNRAWKRSAQLDHFQSAGHKLAGDQISISPVNQIIRHYIVLSHEHAKTKYLNRKFDPADLTLGWHGNRLHFTEKNLAPPLRSRLIFRLKHYDSRNFRRDRPTSKHYWEW